MQGVLQPSRRMPDPVHLLPQYFHPRRYPRIARCTCLSSSAPSTMTVPRSTITSQHPTSQPPKHFCLSPTSLIQPPSNHATPHTPQKKGETPPNRRPNHQPAVINVPDDTKRTRRGGTWRKSRDAPPPRRSLLPRLPRLHPPPRPATPLARRPRRHGELCGAGCAVSW